MLLQNLREGLPHDLHAMDRLDVMAPPQSERQCRRTAKSKRYMDDATTEEDMNRWELCAAELESAVAAYESFKASGGQEEASKAIATIHKAYVDGCPFRERYWESKTMTIFCFCGEKGFGNIFTLLEDGWRPVDEVNYACGGCVKLAFGANPPPEGMED